MPASTEIHGSIVQDPIHQHHPALHPHTSRAVAEGLTDVDDEEIQGMEALNNIQEEIARKANN